jgi:hypothetical protein
MARLQIGVEERLPIVGTKFRATPLDIQLTHATVEQAQALVRTLVSIIGSNGGGAKVEDTVQHLQVKYRSLFVKVRY